MKKQKSIVLWRHRFLLIITRIIALPFSFLYFWFRPRRYRLRKKGPVLVLANHTTEFDVIFINSLFNFPLYIVASEELLNKGWPSRLLNFFFAPIPKAKSISDLAAVKRIKQVVNEGGSVAIFPEGNATITGTFSNLPSATAKLIQFLKIPLIFVNSYGLYFSSPRWSKHRKFGHTGMKVTNIVEVDQYQQLSLDELSDLVIKNLAINAYEQSPKHRYRGFKKAEGLHRLVFVCPICHDPHQMTSKGNKLICHHCHNVGVYDQFGYVNYSHQKYDTVTLDAQTKKSYAQYVKNHYDEIQFKSDVLVHFYEQGATLRSKKHYGQLTLNKDRLLLEYDGKQEIYPMDKILNFAMQTRRKFLVYVSGGISIVSLLSIESSPYKLLITMQLLHGHNQFLKGESCHDIFTKDDLDTTLGFR